MFGLEHYLAKTYSNALREQSYLQLADKLDKDKAKAMRQALQQCLGQFPELKGEFKVEIIEHKQFPAYTREKIRLSIEGYLALPMYVLTPRGNNGKLPTVLALHGHGYGSKEIVGLTASGEEDSGESIHKHFALKLVNRGLKVFAPEMIGFGERMLDIDQKAGKRNSCYRLATHLLLNGKTLAGLRIAEALRIVDYMETLEDVDQKRLGIMGFSGGGLLAAYSSALDQRFRAVVLSGFTNTFKASILHDEHCIDNYIPGILQIAELPEIIGLIAPRHLFIESGLEDTVFPIGGVREAIERLAYIYSEREAEDKLQVDLFSGKHEVYGRKAYDWLKNILFEGM